LFLSFTKKTFEALFPFRPVLGRLLQLDFVSSTAAVIANVSLVIFRKRSHRPRRLAMGHQRVQSKFKDASSDAQHLMRFVIILRQGTFVNDSGDLSCTIPALLKFRLTSRGSVV
jgi:hypothetical protein